MSFIGVTAVWQNFPWGNVAHTSIYSPQKRNPHGSKQKYHQGPIWWTSEIYWGCLLKDICLTEVYSGFLTAHKSVNLDRSILPGDSSACCRVSFPGSSVVLNLSQAVQLFWESPSKSYFFLYTFEDRKGLLNAVCFKEFLKPPRCLILELGELPWRIGCLPFL